MSWASFDGSAITKKRDERGIACEFYAGAGGVIRAGGSEHRICEIVRPGVHRLTADYNIEVATAVAEASAATGAPTAPTNNRGELLGFAHVLAHLVRAKATGPVEIVSDSQYVLNTVTKYYPKRLRDGDGRKDPLKNLDLLAICRTLLDLLKTTAVVRLRWVKAHTPRWDDRRFRYHALPGDPPNRSPAANALASWLWGMNDAADSLAEAASACQRET